MERRLDMVPWLPRVTSGPLRRKGTLTKVLLLLAAACLLAAPASWAQDDRAQRIQALESRILDIRAKLWTEEVERAAEADPACSDDKAKAKAYYDQAVALNEQYRGRATAEYQQQINEVKALNKRHIEAYKRCFEGVIQRTGANLWGVAAYNEFKDFAADVAGRLRDAPDDLQAYLAQLYAEMTALLEQRDDYIARLAEVWGRVEISRGGRARERAVWGMRLLKGDILEVVGEGRVRIEFICGPRKSPCGEPYAEFGHDTLVQLTGVEPQPPDPSTFQGKIELIRGTIRAFIKAWNRVPGPVSIFEIRTPTAAVGSRGTDFVVRYDPQTERTDILLYEGRLEIETASSGTKNLEGQQMLTVERGSAGPIQPLDVSAWQAALATTGGDQGLDRGGASDSGSTAGITPGTSGTTGAAGAALFGALAYSESAGGGGHTRHHDSQATAEAQALDFCRQATGADDCRLLLWFRDACAAFARAGNGAYGAAWGSSQDEADANALQLCQSYGGRDCLVEQKVCSK